MEDKRPHFRGAIHLAALIGLCALVSVYLQRERGVTALDPTGSYRLIVGQEYVSIERVSDGALLERVATGDDTTRAVAAWNIKGPACLVWLPKGGPAGSFWSWRDGRSASIPLTEPLMTRAPWPVDNLPRRPRLGSDGRPDWVVSSDGLRVAIIMVSSPQERAGLLLCVHPWQLPADAGHPLFDPRATFHTHLDGVTSVAWKSLEALAVETLEGPRQVDCMVGPSESQVDPDEVTPQLSPDGRYKLLSDSKTYLRVERVSDRKIVWQIPANTKAWHVQPRWHSQRTLLAVNEMGPRGGTRLHVFTPQRQAVVDLGDLGGEGTLRAPWPSPDGARVVVLIAPVFGHYDIECGLPTCCHLADGQVHRLEPPVGEYQGLDRAKNQDRSEESEVRFYGVRRANWVSPTQLEVWNVFDFEGSQYLLPSTRTCEGPAAAWP